MQPEIDLGPVTLQTFGLMFALGFVVAGLIIGRRLKELGDTVDWAYELILAAAVGGILGAKLWFSAAEGDWALDQIFSGSGLVWYGGAFGASAAVAAYAYWRKILTFTLMDVCAPAVAAGYAVGRIGDQLSGDGDYGKPTDAWWGMGYPNGTVPTPPGVEVYPTPLIEVSAMGLFAILLWRWRDRWHPGMLFGIYLIGSGTSRFFVEFLRRNEDVALGLTLAQIVSVALALIGVAFVLALKDRPVPSGRSVTTA
ncbi:MAG: prolipoprotein diacylglyceryl transferase [Solirubrobacterales bacterium]|nr:prolipoprotein diacylglyceryl transferase [Solirubrobacterales bacterium]